MWRRGESESRMADDKGKDGGGKKEEGRGFYMEGERGGVEVCRSRKGGGESDSQNAVRERRRADSYGHLRMERTRQVDVSGRQETAWVRDVCEGNHLRDKTHQRTAYGRMIGTRGRVVRLDRRKLGGNS